MATTIDTLKLARRFKDVRLTDEQAELFAEVFRETQEAGLAQLVTQQDLREQLLVLRQELREEIAALRQELRDEIVDLRQEFRAEIAALRQEVARLDRRMDGLEHRMAQMEQRIVIRLGLMLAAATGILGTLVAIF